MAKAQIIRQPGACDVGIRNIYVSKQGSGNKVNYSAFLEEGSDAPDPVLTSIILTLH